MSSIMTNRSAMSALQTLRAVGKDLTQSQERVSSGLRVGKAADNAGYWSIATTMRSDDRALSAAQDAMSVGANVVQASYLGMTDAIDVVNDIKAMLVSAKESSIDKNKLGVRLDDLRGQLYSIVDSSSFAGQNWLHRYSADDDVNPQVVAGITRDQSGKISLQNITYDIQAPYGTKHLIDEVFHNGILTNVEYARNLGTSTEWVLMNGRQHDIHPVFKLDGKTTPKDIDEMVGVTEAMLADMMDAASSLGSLSKRIQQQSDFTSNLRDDLATGIGRLVDTNMEEEATRMTALQTQQQLSLQALSIANNGPQTLLSLFGL